MPRAKKTNLVIANPVVIRPNQRTKSQMNVVVRQPQKAQKQRTRRPRRGGGSSPKIPLTPDGVCFLKAATSAPDFDMIGCRGVPDRFAGKSLVKKDYLNSTISVTPGYRTYIVVGPTPGIAYWRYDQAINTSLPVDIVFQGVATPNVNSLFPGFSSQASGSNTSVVDKFRYIGLQAELISAQNQNTWAGTIKSFKTPLALAVAEESVGGTSQKLLAEHVTGVNGIFNAIDSSNSYASTVNAGVYSVSLNTQPDFPFSDIHDNQDFNSSTIGTFAESNVLHKVVFESPVLGIGSLDTIVFVVEVPTDAPGQVFMLRTWSTTEYQPVHGSLLYDFSNTSANHDEVALEAYKQIANNLPIAVSYGENASFWSRVSKIVRGAASMLSHIPGPVGMIASAVGMILD